MTTATTLKAQLPVKSWSTALSTYGRLALFAVLMVLWFFAGRMLGLRNFFPLSGLLMVIFYELLERLLPHPDKVFLGPGYLEVNLRKLHLDEIASVSRTGFTLKVTDHEGETVCLRTYYYESKAVVRLENLMERHASTQTAAFLKTKVTARWWGLFLRFLTPVCLGLLILSFLAGPPPRLEDGDMPREIFFLGLPRDMWSSLSFPVFCVLPVCFLFRGKPVRFCDAYLQIGHHKVMWDEIESVTTSLGFVRITDHWGWDYRFHTMNYDRAGITELRRRLLTSARPLATVGGTP